MKILYVVTQRPWPLTVGSRIRSYHVIKGLARNHDVTIALVTDNPAEGEEPESDQWPKCRLRMLNRKATTFSRSLLSRLWTRYRMVMHPAHKDVFRESMLNLIDEVRPDVTWYYQATPLWMAGCVDDIPCVYDMDDFESRKYSQLARHSQLLMRFVITLDTIPFARDEWAMLRRANVVLVSNPNDLSVLDGKVKSSVIVLPNGFDFKSPNIRYRQEKRILFFGCMTYGPCADGIAWFCDSVWPKIIKMDADTRLDIVGSYPAELARLSKVQGVTMHGFVENLEPFIQKSAFLVVPLRIAGGTRIKILEAWAKGLPVVSTSIGCEGLGAKDGVHLLIGDTPEVLAEKCVELLRSPELGQKLAQESFDYGKQTFDWEQLYPILERALSLAK
ncbi:MAG: glycosyltransferase family 4 protein [Armatimonadetes bacterium]|nr:glycosyltransferase family 4 protein [Armatimonadota bacterium]